MRPTSCATRADPTRRISVSSGSARICTGTTTSSRSSSPARSRHATGYVLDLKQLSDRHPSAGHPGRGPPQPEYRRAVAAGAYPDRGEPRPGLLGEDPLGAPGRDCCGRSACGRPTRTGPKLVITPKTPPRRGREVRRRYTTADLSVLTRDEARRFVPRGDSDPQIDIALAWELLYRLEPELYDRLVSAERLHPGVLGWLPDQRRADRRSRRGHGSPDARADPPCAGGRCGRTRGALAPTPRSKALASGPSASRPGHAWLLRRPARDRRLRRPGCRMLGSHARQQAMAASPAWRRWSGSAGRVAASSSSGQTTSTGSPPMAIGTRASPARCLSSSPAYEEAAELAEIFYPSAVAEVRRLGREAGSVRAAGDQPAARPRLQGDGGMRIAIIAPLVHRHSRAAAWWVTGLRCPTSRAGFSTEVTRSTSTPPPDRTFRAFR